MSKAPKTEKKKRTRKPRTYIVLQKTGKDVFKQVAVVDGVRNFKHLVRKIRNGEVALKPGEYVAISKRAFLSIPSTAFEPPKRKAKK